MSKKHTLMSNVHTLIKNTLWLKNCNHHLNLQWVIIILLVEDLNISRNTKMRHKGMKWTNAIGKIVMMPLNELLHFKSSSNKVCVLKIRQKRCALALLRRPDCWFSYSPVDLYTRIGSVLATWSGHTNILSWPFLKYKKPFKIICRWGRLTKFIFGKCFADCGGQYKCVLLHTKGLHVLPCEYVKITITKSTSLKQEAW